MKPTEVKEILSHIISTISDDPSDFLQNPSKDFTRNRKLSFETIIKMMIGMGGNSLCKEIYDWFNYAEDTASVSAFVQQRQKISSKALEYIFREMVKQCDEQILFKGYRLLAVDESDIRLPKNKNDNNSYIKNDDNTKGYNLLHLDAMYDLMQHTYVDASIQSKKGMNEHKALVSMIEKSQADVLGTAPDVVAEAVENQCENERLCKQLNRLSGREKWVLEMRFGMPDGDRKTQRDIAKLLGISRSYVSRIEKKAIGKLGDHLSEEDR